MAMSTRSTNTIHSPRIRRLLDVPIACYHVDKPRHYSWNVLRSLQISPHSSTLGVTSTGIPPANLHSHFNRKHHLSTVITHECVKQTWPIVMLPSSLSSSPSILACSSSNDRNVVDPERTYILRISAYESPSGFSGSGMVLYDHGSVQSGKEIWSAGEYETVQSGNRDSKVCWLRATYRSLAPSLRLIRQQGVRKIIVQTDSDILLRQLKGVYRVSSPKIKQLYWSTMLIMQYFDSLQMAKINRDENFRAHELAKTVVGTRKSVGWGLIEAAGVNICMTPCSSSNNSPRLRLKSVATATLAPTFALTKTESPISFSFNRPIISKEKPVLLLDPQVTYLLRVDGGARARDFVGGVGMVLYDTTGRRKKELWCGWKLLEYHNEHLAGCNISEYTAMLLGIQCARSLGVSKLLVESDSQLVVRQVKGLSKVNPLPLKLIHDDIQEECRKFSFLHVRHIMRCRNQRADGLASQAMDTMASHGCDELIN